jgi:hypothetical protein
MPAALGRISRVLLLTTASRSIVAPRASALPTHSRPRDTRDERLESPRAIWLEWREWALRHGAA